MPRLAIGDHITFSFESATLTGLVIDVERDGTLIISSLHWDIPPPAPAPPDSESPEPSLLPAD